MIPVDQTLFGEYEGNCLVASLASVLEVELASIPHFCKINKDKMLWFVDVRLWLQERYGLDLLPLNYEDVSDEDREGIRNYVKGYHLATVRAPGGCLHSVVIKDGFIVHDPDPRGARL